MKPLLLAPTLAALTLAGCSGSVSVGGSTLDADKAETEISKAVRIQAGVPVKTVECPEDVKKEQGGTFECTVTAQDGTTGEVNVRQKDDEGNVSFDAPFIHMDEAENSIIEQIRSQVSGVRQVEVACPDIVVGKAGAPFECEGVADGKSFTVLAEQTDGKGRFTFNTKTE